MLKISKDEAMELMNRGFKFSDKRNNGVLHRTNSHHRTYYMTETIKAIDALIEIRDKKDSLI